MVVGAARGWLGTPYVHQASCRGAGADCLGLVRGVWREVVGPEPAAVPPYSPDWGETGQDEVLWGAALSWLEPAPAEAPGDVLLFRMRDGGIAKHLGIAVAVGPQAAFVHAYSGHRVVESPLSAPWARRIVARFRYPMGVR
jgi:NlpC/P60 family putative phage cell wall peptidase